MTSVAFCSGVCVWTLTVHLPIKRGCLAVFPPGQIPTNIQFRCLHAGLDNQVSSGVEGTRAKPTYICVCWWGLGRGFPTRVMACRCTFLMCLPWEEGRSIRTFPGMFHAFVAGSEIVQDELRDGVVLVFFFFLIPFSPHLMYVVLP